MATVRFGGLESALTHRIGIYVPGTCNVCRPADQLQAQWTDTALEFCSTLFGGGTAVKAIGAYVSPEKGLVREPMNLVFAYCCEKDFQAQQRHVIGLAVRICRDMGQECVAVEADGALFFVSAHDAVVLPE